MATTPTSQSLVTDPEANEGTPNDGKSGPIQSQAFQLPIETEIYLLPDGQIVIADLPAELTSLLEKIGSPND